jgi:adenylate cyclase
MVNVQHAPHDPPFAEYIMTHEKHVAGAAERVERRLAAILAADVAGYSRLMGADEEGTHARMKVHRRELIDPKIDEYRGRISNIAGDGILVEFASVVDAVRCAVDMQQAMAERNAAVPTDRRIEFRIGVNLGDIIAEGKDIYGDGVNVAARLEGLAEPGGICVSRVVHDQVRDKLAFSFEDMGKQQVKNIARPVQVYRVKLGGAARPIPALALPDKPSIAVLPFENMSDAAKDVYFADGIAEDIITELSRYPDLFVVARNSSFMYRGKTVRVSDMARELGVQYILEGSVRHGGNTVRITVQLIDARSDKHLWAQRYDRKLEDIFGVQDEITQKIVAVLPARVEAAALERASRKTSNSLHAYDYLLRGKYCHHLENPDANREAVGHFDRSIELDPRFASAYAWQACTLGQAWVHEFQPRTPELYREIQRLVETATRLDDNDTECHRIMCRLALLEGKFEKSEHHLGRALALNPNDPRLVVQRGINLTMLGDPAAAIPWIERAMRIDPFSADRYYLDLVRALFMAERAPDAIAILQRTPGAGYEHCVWLAACCATAGDRAAARQAAEQIVALRPGFSISAYVDAGFAWKLAEDKARLRDALLQCGISE